MKNLKIYVNLAVTLLLCLFLNSCKDQETMNKLTGTWKSSYNMSEDGMTFRVLENVTYNSDGSFSSVVDMKMTSPVSVRIGSISYQGTWEVTSGKLLGTIDEHSINLSFSSGIGLSRAEKEEVKEEFLNGFKEADYMDGGKILSISEDSFSIKDEEDGKIYHYKRV